jgi:HEAT repeat protein
VLAIPGASCDRSGPAAEQAAAAAGARPDHLQETIASLICRLDADSEDGDNAATALVALGPVVLDPLAKALERSSEPARRRIIDVLEQVGTPDAVPVLLLALKEGGEWDTRLAAVEALGKLPDRRAVAPLMAHYRSEDDGQVRYECLTSLGLIGDRGAVDFLVEEVGSTDPYARMWALDALCVMQAPEAITLGPALLQDPDPRVRSQTLRSCGASFEGAAGRRALIDTALYGDDFRDSVWARRYLRQQRSRSAGGAELTAQMRRAAIEALAGPSTIRAAMLLGDLGDPAATEGLITALGDRDLWVRHHAAFLLGRLGDRRGVAPLIAALEDEQDLVAASAHDALKRFAEAGDTRAQAAVRTYGGKTFGKPLPDPAG